MVNQVKKWKKYFLWTCAAVVALAIVAVVSLVMLLDYNQGFRKTILGKAETGIYESTGARLSVVDFKLRLSNISVDLYNVVVRGTEQDHEQPLLSADHVQAGLTIDSVLRGKWHVRNIIIDHPVVRLSVDAAGQNNLPKPPKPATSGSHTNVFDLAIGALKLARGEIYYNDQEAPLEAELHDLKLNANYDAAQTRYAGTLSYDNGRLVYGKYAPVEHNMQAGFEVTPQNFTLSKLELSAGKSRLLAHVQVTNYNSLNRQASGNYDAVLMTSDFQRILKDPSLPTGAVRLTGQVNYQADVRRPVLETVSVSGNVSSAALAVKTPTLQTEVRDIFASYQLSGGSARVENLRARVLDGTVSGRLTIRDLAGAAQGRLQLAVKDLSLDQAQTATRTESLRQAHLTGRLSADTEAHWAKTLKNLTAHTDATLKASLGKGPATPLEGVVHADYAAASKEIAFRQSYMRTPQTVINLNGKVSDRSQLVVAMQSSDLHELEVLAAALQKPKTGEASPALGLYGTATLNATVRGSTSRPEINGQMEARNLRVKGSAWKILRTTISANPSQLKLSNGDLEAATQGRVTFNVQAGLKRWSYAANSPVVVALSGEQISIAELERLTSQTFPATGTMAFNVSLHGSQLQPVGQGNLSIVKARVANENVHRLDMNFQGNGEAINANMTVRMPAGTTQAKAAYFPASQTYQVEMQAQDFRVEKLQGVIARDLHVAGSVNLYVTGHGTVKDPALQATLEVPQLTVNKQNIQGIKLQATVQNHVANIALDSNVLQTYIRARGTVGIVSPYLADLKLDTGRVDFHTLMALYSPQQAANVSGQTELHASVHGPLAEKTSLEAHLELPTLSLAYNQFQLGAAKPVRVDYQNGTAVLQPASIRGTGTAIDAQGAVPIGNTGRATFLVKGNIDLQAAQLFVPDLTSTGQIQFDVDSSRYGASSNLNGQIKIVDANLHTLDSPVGLDHANGTINVTQARLEIAGFQGEMGGGTLLVTGGAAYRPSVQFNLGLEARNIRVRYPEGVRTIVASNLALTGNMQQSLLSGQVSLDRVSFTPDFDLNTFSSQFAGGPADAGTPGSLAQGMKLNVSVQSTNQMNLESSQVSIRGNANLRLVGTAAEPVILGRTNLTGGELFLAGNRYEIKQGTIDFMNPVRTQPVLNLNVTSKINEYNIALNLNGPLDHLQTTYTSDPSLPPVDIINLIARGQTTESAAANPNPPGTLGAQAVVASAISSQVSGRIAKLAGVSQLQIDPALGTDNGQNPGARVAIQQRVTSNLLVTYATDITSVQRQAIQIEYKLNPRWSVSGTRNQNGGFGVDGRYRKDF